MTKAEKTRQFLIEQTAPIFNTKGVAATAVSDIMQATHLAKGSLYAHFENKEELAYCAVDYNLSDFFEKAGVVTQSQEYAKDKFFALLDLLSDPVNHPVQGGCPMLNFGVEADDTSPVIREKVRTAMEALLMDIVRTLEKGISDGEFVGGWDVNEFAVKAFAMLEGGILMSRVYGNSASMTILNKILKREIEEKIL